MLQTKAAIAMNRKAIIITCLMMFVTSSTASSSSSLSNEDDVLEIMTFNTGLVQATENVDFPHFVGSTGQRLDAIIAALDSSSADVICLQEVFDGLDVQTIVDGVTNFPYSFSDLHDGAGQLPNQSYAIQEAPCNAEFTPLLECYSLCEFFGTPDLQCLAVQCPTVLDTFFGNERQECITCLTSSLPDLDNLEIRCTTLVPLLNANMNTPGLLMLSKDPLFDGKYVDYYPNAKQTIRRGYLQAKVDNKWTAVCTHLSSVNVPFFETETNQASYEAQNKFESEELNRLFLTKRKVMIAGDLNNGLGPNGTGLVDTLPESYNTLIGTPQTSTFRTIPVTDCTLCDQTENVLRPANAERTIVDHVLASKGITLLSSERTMLGTFSYISGQNGNPDLNLSDHFGVKTMFRLKNRCDKSGSSSSRK